MVPAYVSVQTSCTVRRPAVCSVHALICTVSASSAQSGGDEGGREGWTEDGGEEGGQTRLAQHPPPPAWLEAKSYQMPDVRHCASYFFAILHNFKEFTALHSMRCANLTLLHYKVINHQHNYTFNIYPYVKEPKCKIHYIHQS